MSARLQALSALRNFQRIVYGLDTSAVLDRIASRPELWSEITARQEYGGTAHADTETIFLRAPARVQDVLNVIETVDMPALDALDMRPIVDAVCMEVGIRDLGRVMLVKLKPNGVIQPHVDEGRYAHYYSRFHCVLSTSADCVFYAGGESVHMAAGEIWWFNHMAQHEVRNGTRERIHLIFDGTAPGFTGALT